MGSAGVEDAAAFLERCAASGDAAYGELKALLGRLHDDTPTRRAARAFLTALRPFCSGADSLARYGFRIHDLSLLDCAAARTLLTDDDQDQFSGLSVSTRLLLDTRGRDAHCLCSCRPALLVFLAISSPCVLFLFIGLLSDNSPRISLLTAAVSVYPPAYRPSFLAASEKMAHVLISQLAFGGSNNKIRVRVSRLWHFYDLNDDTKLLHTDLVLLDEGNSIHAQIYPPHTQKYNPLLQEQKVYDIDSYSVKRAKAYRPVQNNLMIEFSNWTELEECIDVADDFPGITFSLTPFQEIRSLVDKSQFYVDVMGIITEIGSVSIVRPKSRNTDSLKRTLQLSDASGSNLPITLWGERATAFDGKKIYTDGQTEPQLAVFVGTLVKDYRDIGLTITGSSPCKWYINLDMPEAVEMKESFTISFQPIKWVEASGPAFTSGPPEEKTVEQLLLMNPHKSKHLRFIVNVTIKKICNEAAWWYYACSKCYKGARPFGSSYRCTDSECGKIGMPSLKYKLVVMAGDGTKDAPFVLFGKIAQRLIRTPVQALIEQNPHGRDFIPDEITALLEQKFVWNVSFTENTITRGRRPVETFQVNSIISSVTTDQPPQLMAPPASDSPTDIVPFSPTGSAYTPPASTKSTLGSPASGKGKGVASPYQSSSTPTKQPAAYGSDQTPTSKLLPQPGIKKNFVLSMKPALQSSTQVSSQATQQDEQINKQPSLVSPASKVEEKPSQPATKEDESPDISSSMTIKEIGKKRGKASSSAPAARKLFNEPAPHDETDSA